MSSNALGTAYLLSAIVVAGQLAGCATTPSSPKPIQSNMVAQTTAAGKYAYVLPHHGSGVGKTFYLVKSSSGWDVTLEQQDIRSPGIERLTYWPSSRKFAFQFSNDYALHGKWIVCPAVKVEKTSMGYVPCTTEFKGAAGLNGTRTLVGVMTLGLSELAGVANSKEQFVIDEEALSAVVNRFDLDKKIADYMRAEPTKVALAAKQAPVANSDSLARQAELETNVNVLREAVKSVGDVASYQRRFTPTHPERYCDEFKSDMGMLASCKATVRQTVTNLAYDRAVAARRHDICARVSMAVTKITQKDICHQYKSSGSCSGSTPLEIKTCNILLSRG